VLELGAESCSTKVGVDEFVGLKDDFSLVILEWGDKNPLLSKS